MQHHIEITSEKIAIIRLGGELDHHAARHLREDISQAIYSGYVQDIIWNLEGLQFMDSAGVGLILGRMRDLQVHNGRTLIIKPSSTMEKIFQFSGLGKYIWHDTEQEAIQSLGGILHG